MSKSHRTAGLDQLGPKHAYKTPTFHNFYKHWPKAGMSIASRAALSTRNRKVKVTLPCLKILETMK
jgi:hypothetical protein